jgi:tetratricopeptide (TPR) repeat protein
LIDRRAWLAALAAFVVAIAVYLPKTGNHFTFDDGAFILRNPYLHDWRSALGEFGRDQARLYRPLRSLALAALTGAFGQDHALPFHLAGIFFHAVCAALTTLIVWLLVADPLPAIRNSQFAMEAALVAGLIFALHPVHADRVANITGSFDLLGLALGWTAWLLALAAVRAPRAPVNRPPSAPSTVNRQPSTVCAVNRQPSTVIRQPSTVNRQPSTVNRQPSTSVLAWGAALLMLLGCLASEEALMALPLAALSIWLPFPSAPAISLRCLTESKPRQKAKHPFRLFPFSFFHFPSFLSSLAFAALAYLALRAFVLGGAARTTTYAAGNLASTFWTMPVVVWRYIGLLIFPVGLSPAYAPTIHTHADPLAVAALLGVAGLITVAIAVARRAPVASMALGWFLLGLAPFSNLLPGDTLMAERYLYAGLGGFALAGGVAFAALRRAYRERPRAETRRHGVSGTGHWPLATDHCPDRPPSTVNRQPSAASVVLAAILVLYSAGVVSRCRAWGSPLRLWTEAATREPNSFLANLNAGYHTLQAHRLRDGERFAQQANRLDPQRAEPLLQLAEVAFQKQAPAEGLRLLEAAIKADPSYCASYDALASRRVVADDPSGAAQAAAAALHCDPADPSAHYVFAYLLFSAGRCEQAAPHIDAVLRAFPRPREYAAALELREKCRK